MPEPSSSAGPTPVGSTPRRPSGPSPARAVALRWIAAAVVGMTFAVTLVERGVLPNAPSALRALLALFGGWVILLSLAPWRSLWRLDSDRGEMRRLTRALRRFRSGRRDGPLTELILDRNDALGDLSRAIHACLAETLESRHRSRRLQRDMHDTIRRETTKATAHLQREATTDPLTGLGNRRALEQHLGRFFGTDDRRRREILIAMLIDMDHFKTVNDSLGHDAGDQCLCFFGELLFSTLRRGDCAVRLGGDEFVVVMSGVAIEEASAVAQRICAMFCQMPWPHGHVPRPTLSIGIAAARAGEPDGAEKLLRRADVALYEAKRDGRDRVVCHRPGHAAA